MHFVKSVTIVMPRRTESKKDWQSICIYMLCRGLIDFVIPLLYKGQYVGAFLAGQVTSTDFGDLKKITTQSEDWKDNQNWLNSTIR